MKKKRVGFFSGLDFVTFITALIGSCYGLALVYSATYSTLKNGAIIASGVKSMLISTLGGIIFALIVCNIDYEIISKLWPIVAAGWIAHNVLLVRYCNRSLDHDRIHPTVYRIPSKLQKAENPQHFHTRSVDSGKRYHPFYTHTKPHRNRRSAVPTARTGFRRLPCGQKNNSCC